MSSRHLVYLSLSVVALFALVASAALVFSYRPPGDTTAALVTPTPTSHLPTESLAPGQTPNPNPTDRSGTEQPGTPQPPQTTPPGDPLAKDTLGQSLDPEKL